MRTGYSYERGARLPMLPKPKYSICFVTYVGDSDWYTERPRIRDISFRTMLDGIDRSECEVIVWDNNGTKHQSPLADRADYIIYSPNICNWNARRNMLAMARGDIVCLTDDDILFSKDWLHRQVKILLTYPNVGFVHGSPSKVRVRDNAARKWAHDNAKIVDTSLPEKWQEDFALARNRPIRFDTGNACLCEYRGVRAWTCALDQQFIGTKETLKKFYAHETPILFDESALNERVAAAGYLCFSTEKRTGIHMGNVIDESIVEAAQEMGVSLE